MASAKSDRGMSIMKENEIVLFETKDKEVKLNVKVGTDTVWLSRNQMADLFDRDVKTIGKHINNALKEELDNSTVAYFATVQNEGGRNVERDIEYYNLEMIISVGYRVKSQRGIEFRRWANKVNVFEMVIIITCLMQDFGIIFMGTRVRAAKDIFSGRNNGH
jgi:hypothetical protein